MCRCGHNQPSPEHHQYTHPKPIMQSLAAHSTSPSTVWCAVVLIPLFQLVQLGTCPLSTKRPSVSVILSNLVAIRHTTARHQLPTLPLLTVVVLWLEV